MLGPVQTGILGLQTGILGLQTGILGLQTGILGLQTGIFWNREKETKNELKRKKPFCPESRVSEKCDLLSQSLYSALSTPLPPRPTNPASTKED